jgi:hypothetical protein
MRMKADMQRVKDRGLEPALTGTESVKRVLENRARVRTAVPRIF